MSAAQEQFSKIASGEVSAAGVLMGILPGGTTSTALSVGVMGWAAPLARGYQINANTLLLHRQMDVHCNAGGTT